MPESTVLVPQGGMFVCRPKPILFSNGSEHGLTLMSDLHIGARNVDYDLIHSELETAKKKGDRVAINGDIFDMILIGDRKRFRADVLHPRLVGKPDVINGAIEWGLELLSPYADLIDMIGVGNHEECFDAQTEVLTNGGWVKFPELTPEKEVASYRVDNGEIEFAKPLAIHKYYHNGEMINIKNVHTDLLVTPNHRILYRPSGWKPFKSRNRGTGTLVQYPSGGWDGRVTIRGKVKYTRVLPTREEATTALASIVDQTRIYLSNGWRLEEAGSISHGIDKTLICAGVVQNKPLALKDEYIKLAAWILTDGWVTEKSGVSICQRQSKAHLIRNLLDKCDLDYAETIESTARITHICGTPLKKPPQPQVTFRLRGSSRKKLRALVPHKNSLPKWLWKCSKEQFRVFLEAYVDGVGTRPSSNSTCNQIYGRPHLLDDLQALCSIFGIRTSMRPDYQSKNSVILYTADYTTTSFGTNVSFDQIQYSGMVYCVTTHNDTVVVRRNGKVSITGNSVSKYHNVDPVKLLLYELTKKQKDPNHIIHYGGYSGFLDYRFRSENTTKRKTGIVDSVKPVASDRFIIYYHHGTGGSAPVTGGMIDFARVGWAVGDVVWFGHRHRKLTSSILTVECPIRGDNLIIKEVRHIQTGAYFDTYQGQSQESFKEHGRLTNYAADSRCAPYGKGGARLVINYGALKDGYKIKVIQ